MDVDPEKVGGRLRQCAEAKGVSQSDVARSTGFNTGTLSRYFNGVSLPKSLELLELSKFFDVSMEWILTGETRDTDALRVNEKAVPYKIARQRHLEEAARDLEEIVEKLRKMDGGR